MKEIKAKWKELLKNRKLRCGSLAAALTAAAVVLALLAGALADGLEKRYALQMDFSFNSASSQGEVTRAVLAQLEKDVEIYAVIPSGGGNPDVLSLLNRYDAASPHVTVKEESLIKNPVLQSRFSDAVGDNQVTDDCLIVYCPATERARVLKEEDWIYYAYNMETGYFDETSYAYEKCVTEGILFVTQDDVPVLQILTGHGEMTADETAVMEETLLSANYQIRRVNLAAGDELNADSPLLILCPRYDLSAAELEQLMDFARAGGDFFIASRYSDPLTMENYASLLRAWGAECYPGMVIAKESDRESYYASSPVILMPYMQETDVTRTLIKAGEDILLLTAARAFRLPEKAPEGVMLSPILMTGEAYIRNIEDGLSVSDQQPGDEEGRFCVALWSDKMMENGETSQMFLIGDLSLFLDYWMSGSTSSTAFLLQIMRSLQGRDPVNLDITPVSAQRDSLTPGSLLPAVIVTVMLPLLVLLGALLVLWPRRNL